MSVTYIKPTLTAVVRDNKEVHILKARIIDETTLYFQMYNKTDNKLSPCFIIPSNFGGAKWIKQDKTTKAIDEMLSNTKYINRYRLKQYFNTFKLNFLVKQFNK